MTSFQSDSPNSGREEIEDESFRIEKAASVHGALAKAVC